MYPEVRARRRRTSSAAACSCSTTSGARSSARPASSAPRPARSSASTWAASTRAVATTSTGARPRRTASAARSPPCAGPAGPCRTRRTVRSQPVDLAEVDRILEEYDHDPARMLGDPRGDPGGLRLPAGRRAQAHQPRDRRVVRDDLRHRELLRAPALRAADRDRAGRRRRRPPARPRRPTSRRSTPRSTGGGRPGAPARRLTMVDLLRTPAAWPRILLARADAADPTDLDAAVAAGAFDGLRRAIRDLGGDRDDRHDRRLRPARPGRCRLSRPATSGGPPPTTEAAAALRRGQRLRRRPGLAHRPDADAPRPVRGHRGRRPSRPSPSAPREAFIAVRAEDTEVIAAPVGGRSARRPTPASSARTSWARATTCGSTVRPVQGAYMLGEETVLLKALEGKRGQPEQRPPHPAERGLFELPTVVHNVQTLAAVPWIVREGADAFAAIGDGPARRAPSSSSSGRPAATASPRSRSARRCATSSSSAAKLPAGRSLQAVLVGGPSGGLLPPDALDTPYTFDALRDGRCPPRLGLGRRGRRPDRPARARRRADPLLLERGVRQVDPVPDRHEAPGRDRRRAARTACSDRSTTQLAADLAARHRRLRAVRPRAPGDPPADQRDAILRVRVRPRQPTRAGRRPRPPDDRHPRPTRAAARSPRRTRGRRPDSLAERLLETQSPQRPQSTPRIRIEVDGRVVEGFEGQTILEVCRDNGIEIPTLCYEPKLPGFGACRMCVVEVEGEEHPPISCSRVVRGRDEGPDPDRGGPPAAPDQPRADLQRPQRVLPAAVPEQVPEPHRHPGLPQGQRRGELAREHADLQADDPVPVACSGASARPRARSTAGATRSTRRSPSATRIATPATRSSSRCSTRASTRRSRSSSRRRTGRRAAVIGSGPAGMAAAFYLLLAGHDVTVFERDPAPGGMLRYGIPQYRLPKVEVLEAEYESVTPARRQDRLQRRARARLHARRPDQPGLRLGRRRHRLLRHEQAGHPGRGRRRRPRRPRVPAHRHARPAVPGPRRASGSSSSAAASPRWTARGRRSARAPARSRSSTAAT